jgi:hypothetical protein
MLGKLFGLYRTGRASERRLCSTRRTSSSRRTRPALEELEPRLVPTAYIYWDNVPGEPKDCEIRLSGSGNTVLIDHNQGGYLQVTGLDGTTVINTAHSYGTYPPAQVAPSGTPTFLSDASYSDIWVTGGTGGNTVFVNRNVKPLYFQPDAQQSPYPGSPTDQLNLGYGTLQDIQAPITVNDAYGTVKVDLYAQNDWTNRQVGLDYYNGYGAITGLTGQASAVISYATSHITALTLHLGTGQNFVDVPYTFATTTIQGNGSMTVSLGNVGGGNTLGALGALTVTNTVAGGTTLCVDDSADPSNHPAVNLSSGSITGLTPAPISFDPSSVGQIVLATGTGPNTVNVLATAMPTTIIGHSTHTSVYVGNQGSLAGIAGGLSIEGTVGLLKLDDSADRVFRQVNIGRQIIAGGYLGPRNPVEGAVTWSGLSASVSYGAGSIGELEIDTGIGGAFVLDADYVTQSRLVGQANATNILLEELPWVTTMEALAQAGASFNLYGNLSLSGY